jgi:hypothetical protein
VQNAAAAGFDWATGQAVVVEFDPASAVILAGGA